MSLADRNAACARWLLSHKFATLHDVMQGIARRGEAERRAFAVDLDACGTFAQWPDAGAVVAWWGGLTDEAPAALFSAETTIGEQGEVQWRQ